MAIEPRDSQFVDEPEALDLFIRDSTACMDDLLQAVTALVRAYSDLLELVEGLQNELAATSAQVAALQAERAAVIVAQSRSIEADAGRRTPLRRVGDNPAASSPRRAAG